MTDSPAWLESRRLHVGDVVVVDLNHGGRPRGTVVKVNAKTVDVRLASGTVVQRKPHQVEKA
jgi:hypothetical protein